MTTRTLTGPLAVYTETSGAVPPKRLNQLKSISTLILLFTIVIAGSSLMYAEDADDAFRIPGYVMGIGLAFAFWVEGQAGLRNLIRIDLFMLSVLFLLTFFEFLLPQDPISDRVSFIAALTAVQATLVGFAGIIIGRHACPAVRPLQRQVAFKVSPRLTFQLLLACAFLGYFYMLLAVQFNLVELVYQLTRPRFSQPWTRGRYGSLATLLNEFGLLKYLIPPLAAAILSQRRRFQFWQVFVAMLILSLLFLESFAGGTRNVFLTHLITFSAAYALLMPKLTIRRVSALFLPMLAIAYFAIYYLPEIRTVGLRNFDLETARTDTLFVDNNLVNIALLTEVFPEKANYLGFEIPYVASVRPIPRALWQGKPEGLSLGIEEALGASTLTLSATFVGEFWMAAGYIGILLGALLFGSIASLWNRRANRATTSTEMIVFAVGLFPAGLGMRSFMSVFPTLLPLFAILGYLRLRPR